MKDSFPDDILVPLGIYFLWSHRVLLVMGFLKFFYICLLERFYFVGTPIFRKQLILGAASPYF